MHGTIRPAARLVTAALVAAAVGLTAVVPASAGSYGSTAVATGTTSDAGLFGSQDPTYDGVYRQALTLVALHSAGARIEPAAVGWLRRQQCADGRWTSYRADVGSPCGPGDSNATAMAVMALTLLGRDAAAGRGTEWLVSQQQRGGGWVFSTQWPSAPDANSTGLVVQALLARGIAPRSVTRHGDPFDFLRSVQLGCSSARADRGAIDYQVEDPLVANDYATAQVGQALARATLPVQPTRSWSTAERVPCGTQTGRIPPADAASGYLARLLAGNGGLVPPVFGTDPDYGSTANAVLSLVAAGVGRRAVRTATTALEDHVRRYVLDKAREVLPAAAALMVLTEHATRGNPRDVDGVDLVHRLMTSIRR